MLRKLYKPVVAAAVAFAIIAAILEVGLRSFGVHDPILYEADGVAGYRLKPDQSVSFFGNAIAVNRFGVRDARSFEEKPQGTTRIVVLGDSVTWGGVRLAQTDLFTHRLEQDLNNAEVINAGVNGYSTFQMAALYREHLAALEADVVIVYVIPGDFLRPPVADLVRSSPAFPLERSMFALSAAAASARIVLGARLNWEWLQPSNPAVAREDLGREKRVERNVGAILALREQLSGEQALIVAVSPFLVHAANPALPDTVTPALASARVPLWILEGEELERPDLFVDHIHLSPEGHTRVAEELATRLRGELGLD